MVSSKEPSSLLQYEVNNCEAEVIDEPLPRPLSIKDSISFVELYDSVMRCKKGVTWKPSCAYFVHHALEQTHKLCDELNNGKYKERPIKQFNVYYPKLREVVSISFRDRVYQRSLNDNIVYPIMTSDFIPLNCACQKGKGTDYARESMLRIVRSFVAENKWNIEGLGYLQCDIKSYYGTMSHSLTERMFSEELKDIDGASDRVIEILRNQYKLESGYNPGSQLVQIAGIAVLNPIDHYISEVLELVYIRYMDDFFAFGKLQELPDIKNKISTLLHDNFELSLHPKKTKIMPLSHSFTFLGFDYHVTETGQVYMMLNPKKTKDTRRKLIRMAHLVGKGLIDISEMDNTYMQYRNYAKKGKSRHLLERMDIFYQTIRSEALHDREIQDGLRDTVRGSASECVIGECEAEGIIRLCRHDDRHRFTFGG